MSGLESRGRLLVEGDLVPVQLVVVQLQRRELRQRRVLELLPPATLGRRARADAIRMLSTGDSVRFYPLHPSREVSESGRVPIRLWDRSR